MADRSRPEDRASSCPPSPTTDRVPGDWTPNPGPQSRFLSLTCFEALYGGSAGGGKSDALLADAVRYVGRGYGPAYQALLLRRTFPALEKSLILRSHDLYPRIGGRYNEQKKAWIFQGGERVVFGYLERDTDVQQYQGGAFCFIGFDELTQFSLKQYVYLISRCRSAQSIPCRLRGTTNPGSDGHAWVFERFKYWLDPKRQEAGPGEILYFVRDDDGTERVVPKGTLDIEGHAAIGRTFVPAKLSDNPYLAEDGVYARALDELDPVERARLKGGNWLVQPGAGLYFKRAWCSFLDAAPDGLSWVRAWDLAATPKTRDNDPDWTVGVKMACLPDGRYLVGHVARLRGGPGEVRDLVRSTAEADGMGCTIRLPQDPGQAGVYQKDSFAGLLRGFNFKTKRPTGDKVTRFGPFSSQAEHKKVVLLHGSWNDSYLDSLEAFPDARHDDDVDATSDAFDEQATPRVSPPTNDIQMFHFDDTSIGL